MTTSINPKEWLHFLIAALARLAAPAEAQLTYLSELGVTGSIDELGLEFDDFFRPLEPFMESSQGWEKALETLRELNSSLESVQLPWNVAALRQSSNWENIRRMAAISERLVKETATTNELE